MGLLINRPVEGLSVAELLGRLGVKSSVDRSGDLVLLGGPVEGERGFVLHTDDYACAPSSIEIAQGIALTATRDVLEAIAGHNRQPRRSLMALGYLGWGAGQLENELRENVWLTCEADEELLFGGDHEHKWSRALGKIGVAAEHLSGQAGRA